MFEQAQILLQPFLNSTKQCHPHFLDRTRNIGHIRTIKRTPEANITKYNKKGTTVFCISLTSFKPLLMPLQLFFLSNGYTYLPSDSSDFLATTSIRIMPRSFDKNVSLVNTLSHLKNQPTRLSVFIASFHDFQLNS